MDPFTLLSLIGAGGGLLGGILNPGNERQRIEEEYNRKAYGQLLRALEANQNLNPAATARAAIGEVSSVQDSAIQNALNGAIGSAQTTTGDAIATQAGIRGSVAAQAAGAPFAQARAGIRQNQLTQEMQKIDQARSIGDEISALTGGVTYDTNQPQNRILNALEGALGGLNAGTNADALLDRKNIRIRQSRNTEQPIVQNDRPRQPLAFMNPLMGLL